VISGWLIKVVLGIALAGAIVIEVGSPLVAKAQADDAATQIADETSFRLRDNFTQAQLEESCTTEADKRDVEIVTCDFDRNTNEVVVRVRKEARSLVLKNWSATEDWYLPEATKRRPLR
jgi:hypothetical protein